MHITSEILTVYDLPKSKVVAQVVLNGYDIKEGICTVPHGAMRSFKVVKGDLWEFWNRQEMILLSDDMGKDSQVRVAALPVDKDSFGLIEFI